MPLSQNGWPTLTSGDSRLVTWVLHLRGGTLKLRLRRGSAGFLICHLIVWWDDVVERVYQRLLDDWGWAFRAIRGRSTGYSNHASGTASDINATKHPLGRTGTLSKAGRGLLRARILWYRGTLRWGGDYHGRKDEMHVEINAPLAQVEKRARALMNTPRGKRILSWNPKQKAVILK